MLRRTEAFCFWPCLIVNLTFVGQQEYIALCCMKMPIQQDHLHGLNIIKSNLSWMGVQTN